MVGLEMHSDHHVLIICNHGYSDLLVINMALPARSILKHLFCMLWAAHTCLFAVYCCAEQPRHYQIPALQAFCDHQKQAFAASS